MQDQKPPPLIPLKNEWVHSQFHRKTLKKSAARKRWKKLLPIFAVSSVGLLFLWPIFDEYFLTPKIASHLDPHLSELKITNTLVSPRINTLDDKGRAVYLSADSALQTQQQTAQMQNPVSKIEFEDGRTATIRANEGVYNPQTQKLNYQQAVQLHTSDGTVIKTTQATFDLNQKDAQGAAPIIGHGAIGSFQGQGFKVKNQGSRLEILGKSKLILHSKRP